MIRKTSRRKVRSYIHLKLAFQLIAISGVFGVPLDLLVEREGADSLLGATRATLRVPSFIDDVISAMRQMGQLFVPRLVSQHIEYVVAFQTCRSRVSLERTGTSVD
jgi:hypothetical protein